MYQLGKVGAAKEVKQQWSKVLRDISILRSQVPDVWNSYNRGYAIDPEHLVEVVG